MCLLRGCIRVRFYRIRLLFSLSQKSAASARRHKGAMSAARTKVISRGRLGGVYWKLVLLDLAGLLIQGNKDIPIRDKKSEGPLNLI